jgi:predicted amidohydrolase
MKIKVAACQMVSTACVEENLSTAEKLITEAAQQGAQLVGLPEYFCMMGQEQDKVRRREPFGHGPLQQFLVTQASRHGVWLVGGTLPLAAPEPDKVLNTTLVYSPQGKLAARYDKMHLFSFSNGQESYDEARTIAPGTQISSFEVPWGRIGLSVCYDLRFPELYRAMGWVNLLMVPSAFTYTTGSAHWDILLRARAIENQCYVLAPAQGGKHENGRHTWGHTQLIDPWGGVIALREQGEGVVMGEIDSDYLAKVREDLPALRHRKM